VTIASFDAKRFEEFYLWMTDEMEYANRTIRQRYMSVGQFIRWAVDAGYGVPSDALSFKPRIKVAPRSVVWLNWDEIKTLYSYRDSDGLKGAWRDVLDCFLLSCFTGLRVSDIRNLRWSDVGEKSIRVLTSKTTDPLVIELNKYSRAIIDGYREDKRCVEFVMPRIERINTSETLKRICRDAGLDAEVTVQEIRAGSRRVEEVKKKWEAVSMHTGRRSFICNALSLGIDPLTIMKWTGHTDYDSMKPYIGIASSDKEKAMGLFDSK
jgi:integrase